MRFLLFWLRHQMAHLLRINDAQYVTWRSLSLTMMGGYKCKTCGKVDHIKPYWLG